MAFRFATAPLRLTSIRSGLRRGGKRRKKFKVGRRVEISLCPFFGPKV
jgi:hypothetical protein